MNNIGIMNGSSYIYGVSLINYILLFGLLLMFFRSRNTLTTLIVFLVLMHFVEVVFVKLLFSKEFSVKANMFNNVNEVGFILFIFCSIFYFFNGSLKDKMPLINTILSFKPIDIFSFILMSGFCLFIIYDSVFINFLDYHKISQNSSPVDEYFIIIFSIILVCSKCRLLVIFPFLLIGLIYVYTGQRMKSLIILYTVYLMLKDSYKYVISFKVLIFAALLIAMISDIMRSQGISVNTQDVHMSHFGELSVTSLYLIEFTENFTLLERIKAISGIFLGNLIPSSFLPDGFDIKRMLVSEIDVPGGGWLPVWFYSLAGYPGVVLIAVIVSSMGAFLHCSLIHVPSKLINDHLMRVFFIIFNSTSVIWFMYSPYVFVKFIIYIGIIYFIYKTFNFLVKMGHRNQRC